MNRRDKTNYYLDMAQVALERGTCLRRNFGAVIVKNDVIVSTGYTGAPRGRANCIDIGTCVRQKMGIPRGERYEFCRSVHAEANAIIAAPREQMLGATLYLVGRDMSTGEIMHDVQAHDHQRRHFSGRHPPRQRYIRHDRRRGLGRARRCARRPDRLLTVTPVQTDKEAFS